MNRLICSSKILKLKSWMLNSRTRVNVKIRNHINNSLDRENANFQKEMESIHTSHDLFFFGKWENVEMKNVFKVSLSS